MPADHLSAVKGVKRPVGGQHGALLRVIFHPRRRFQETVHNLRSNPRLLRATFPFPQAALKVRGRSGNSRPHPARNAFELFQIFIVCPFGLLPIE